MRWFYPPLVNSALAAHAMLIGFIAFRGLLSYPDAIIGLPEDKE